METTSVTEVEEEILDGLIMTEMFQTIPTVVWDTKVPGLGESNENSEELAHYNYKISYTFLSFSTPYNKTSSRRPYRARGNSYNSRGGGPNDVFSRLGQSSNNNGGSPGRGYVGRPAMATSSWSKVTVSN